MYLRDDYGVKRQRVSGTDGGEQSQFSPGKSNRENPPCNTLFIGNLSEGVSKQELEGLFGHQQVGSGAIRLYIFVATFMHVLTCCMHKMFVKL